MGAHPQIRAAATCWSANACRRSTNREQSGRPSQSNLAPELVSVSIVRNEQRRPDIESLGPNANAICAYLAHGSPLAADPRVDELHFCDRSSFYAFGLAHRLER
jgi:hypothetical protein